MGPDERLDRLLSWREVQQVTGLGRTTAWRLRNAGDFPQPVALSPGRVAWRERDIAAWSESRRLPLAPLPNTPPRQSPPPPTPAPCRPVPIRRPPSASAPEPPSRTPAAALPVPAQTPTARPRRRRASAVSEDQLGFDF